MQKINANKESRYEKSKRALFGAMIMCMAVVALGAFAGCENQPAPSAGHVHNWGEWEVTAPATCTAEGVKTRVCTLDASHVQTDKVDKLNHDYADVWTVDVPATCVTDGTETRHCKNCDAKTNARDITATDHDWGEWATTSATCTEDGLKTRVCLHDATHIQTEKLPATDHDWGEWQTTPATCTEGGLKTRVCANDKTHVETVDIPLSAHKLIAHGAVAATCTEAGVQEYWECSVCCNMYADENCEVKIDNPVSIPATDHDWGEWVEKAPATCTEANNEERVCLHNPEHTETRSTVTASGHNYKYVTENPADDKKLVSSVCTVCNIKDDGKATYEYDAAVNADEGKYTFTAVNDESYQLEAADKVYLVTSTHTSSSSSQFDYFTFEAASKGEYKFVFEHLTDNVTVFATAYNGATPMTSRSGAPTAAYKDVLTIKSEGASTSTNVTSITLTLTDKYVGTKFTFSFRSLNVSTKNPAIYLMTVTMPEIKQLNYGANTVEITQSNSFADMYAFMPDETKTYSITAPKGLAVAADDNDILYDSSEEGVQTANFKATAGQLVLFTFSSSATGFYNVDIGEEKFAIITPDAPLSGFTVPCKTVVDGVTSGGVAIAEVGDIEEGVYKLEVTLNAVLMRSMVYFGKNINPDYNEIYGPLSGYGAKGTAEVIYQNMRATASAGVDYNVTGSGTVFTVELTLKAGDKLVFAHSGTVSGNVSLKLTKV